MPPEVAHARQMKGAEFYSRETEVGSNAESPAKNVSLSAVTAAADTQDIHSITA